MNRCGMNMAGLITQIKVGSGGIAYVRMRQCHADAAGLRLFGGRAVSELILAASLNCYHLV